MIARLGKVCYYWGESPKFLKEQRYGNDDYGMLIPRTALGDSSIQELEVVRENGVIVIRPKPALSDTRTRVRHILREAGMLYEPKWETPPPVSPEERARLAEKLV